MKDLNIYKWMLAAGLSCFSLTGAAAVQVYNFSQIGFDEGATISGSFTVNDLDNSGAVAVGTLFGDFTEITAFSLSFSGNSTVGAFNHTLADLTALSYNLNSPYLGDEISPKQEAIGTNFDGTTGFDYYSGMGFGGFGGAVTDKATNAISYSSELVQVNTVPVPGAIWLFGSALAITMGLRKK